MKTDKQLDIFTAQLNLHTLSKAMQLSIDDLKRNHPTRVDIICPMEARLIDLKEAELVFIRLQRDHEKTISLIYEVSKENLELKKQINELKAFYEVM